MAILLDGKAVAATLRQSIAHQVRDRSLRGERAPHLGIILVGGDPASHAYVSAKLKACREVGMRATLMRYETVGEAALLHQIQQINEDPLTDGLIVQLPLPPHIKVEKVIQHIAPEKDVDGFHPLNYGLLTRHVPGYIPATPLGIVTLLGHYHVQTKGKHCVIVGRSLIVGAPLSILMSRNSEPGNATVTLCHSHTPHLASITRQADILVTAVGRPRLITAAMVKEGATVVDVGITREPSTTHKSGYRLQGDVDFEQVAPRCSHITPVPGGVGPMTIASLLHNTLQAAQHLGHNVHL